MSAFHRPAPLMTGASSSCRQTSERPKVCLSPPLSLSSPVIKKKAIQIPSFDEKGLIYERRSTKPSAADKSSEVISSKTSGQRTWSKACQRNHGDRASTLPRAKAKLCSSQSVFAKPNICISPAPETHSPPTILSPKSKPRKSPLLPASQLSDFYPIQNQPEPKPSVSPTFTIPTPRLSPSPTYQEISKEGQQERQPSPVARERRARSISISNTKVLPPNEGRRDVLDQRTLLDFTHPELRRVCPAMSREVLNQTQSNKVPTTSQSSCVLQRKVATNRNENTAKSPYRPGCQSEATERTARQSDSDVLATRSNLRGKSADHSPRSDHTLHSTLHSAFEQTFSGKRAVSPVTPNMSSPTEPHWSPATVKSEMRRRRFDLHDETRGDTTLPSGSLHKRPQEENNKETLLGISSKFFQQAGASQSIKSQQKGLLSLKTQSQTTQMDVMSPVSQSDCGSEDHSCQSTHFDQKMKALLCGRGLNRATSSPATPHTQEVGHSTNADCRFSTRELPSNSDLQSCKSCLNQVRSPGRHKRHKEVDFSDTDLNLKGVLETSDLSQVPAKLPEHLWPPAVTHYPLNTNSPGNSSKGDFDLPQQKAYQRTTPTHRQTHQLHHPDTDRPFITEDSEEPCYVTMYHPDSVYVGEYKHI